MPSEALQSTLPVFRSPANKHKVANLQLPLGDLLALARDWTAWPTLIVVGGVTCAPDRVTEAIPSQHQRGIRLRLNRDRVSQPDLHFRLDAAQKLLCALARWVVAVDGQARPRRHHIDTLRVELRAYQDSAYRVTRDRDAIHNMRSWLDTLANELARRRVGGAP